MPFPFANPWMLAGLSAVAIPLLIRLFARREFTVIPWGAMQFLTAASDRRARLPRTEWLLMALRMGAVALLALAFARPWLAESSIVPPGTDAHRDVVLILDGSASMSEQVKTPSGDEGESCHQRAIRLGEELIHRISRGDTVTLLDARDEPVLHSKVGAHDFATVRESLQKIPSPHGPANLVRAITRGLSLLHQGRNLSQEIIVLTDGQSAAWPVHDAPECGSLNHLLSLSETEPRLFVLDVSEPSVSTIETTDKVNFAVGPLWTSRSHTAVGLPVRIGATLHARGARTAQTVTAHLEIDGQPRPGQVKQIILEPNGEADVEFECPFETPGQHLVAVALDQDPRPADDRVERTIAVSPPIQVMLIDGHPRDDTSLGETFFAAQALGHESDALPWLNTTVINWEELSPAEVSLPAVIVLANVPRLNDVQAAWLEKQVANGAGLLIAPGEHTDAAEYNRLLFRSGEGCLPAEFGSVRTPGAAPSTETLSMSSLCSPLRNVFSEGDGDLLVNTWWSLSEGLRATKFAALRKSGTPLIVGAYFGRGRVLQMSIPLNTDWSNLPTRREFVPLLHEMVLWLVSPDGSSSDSSSTNHRMYGARQRTANIASEAGVAKLDASSQEEIENLYPIQFLDSFAVLTDRSEQGFRPAEFWRWLIVASLFCLVLESILVRRSDHRRNPRSQSSDLSSASQTSGPPQRFRKTRTALRGSVFALLVFLLFEPLFHWTTEAAVGRIVVAVDASSSMETTDPISLSSSATSSSKPDDRFTGSRFAQACEWIEASRTSWMNQLPESVPVEFLLFGDGLEPVDSRLLAPSTQARPGSLSNPVDERQPIFIQPSELHPSDRALGESTDLGTLLHRIATPAGRETVDDPPLAVFLLTDGHDVEQHDILPAAEKLAAKSTRIFPVLIGTEKPSSHLAIEEVKVPRMVFAGERARVLAHLSMESITDDPVLIEVQSTTDDVVARATQPAARRVTVSLELPPMAAGLHEYSLHLSLENTSKSAPSASQSFSLRVVDDKARVTMFDSEARWEFRALDGSLGKDEHIDWRPVLFKQPYLGLLPDTFFPRRLEFPNSTITGSESPFSTSDLVIVGDVAPEDLSPHAWDFLERFVAEEGGTLLFLSGKQHAMQMGDSPVARRLLSVTDIQPIPLISSGQHEGRDTFDESPSFRIQPTVAAMSESAFRFDDDPSRNLAIWKNLPEQRWGLTGTPKPAAWVLADAVPKNSDNNPESQPVMAAQHYGLGQVIWFGIDGTWRWRRRDDQKYHHHFWSSLARAAARNRATFGQGEIRFGTVEAETEVGNEVVLRAQLSPAFAQRLGVSMLFAEIRRGSDNSPAQTWKLTPVDSQPLVREAHGHSLPVGEYKVHLTVEDPSLPISEIVTRLRIRPTRSREREDVRSNPELLKHLAAVGNGKMLRLDDIGRLAALIPRAPNNRTVEREFPLLNHAGILILLILLLTLEWGLRQRAGLP